MSSFQVSIYNRLKLVRIVAVLGLFFSLLFTLNLWAGERYFPILSLLEGMQVSQPYDYVFPAIEMLLLVLLLFVPKPKTITFFLLLLGIYLCVIDFNRLQTWFFVYNLILFALMFYNWRIDNVNHYTSHFILLQLMISAMYFHSAIQKFNPDFVNEVFPALIKSLGNVISDRQLHLVSKAAYVIPIIEIFAALGILIKPLRFIAVPVLIIFHLAVLIFNGFADESSVPMIWIWNISMILFVLFLFTGKTTERFYSVTHLLKQPLFYIIFLVFWIFPFLNILNSYPEALSFSFYSGNTSQYNLVFNEKSKEKLPFYLRHFASEKNNEYYLDVNKWYATELNGIMHCGYTGLKTIRNCVSKQIGADTTDVKFVYIEKKKLFAAQP